jgi:1,4-dihydroxy-6-naphthoate synthase
MLLEPEEIFFRAFRHADFDICELSMSSFTVKTANGDCPYVGVPVFPSRAFRHNSIYIRTDRGIARPEDLKGKRVGVPGLKTSAYLSLKLYQPDFEAVVMPFDKIIEAVKNDVVEAGLLIHEGQLFFPQLGLHKVVDLGIWWQELTSLPLPLGGNAVRRVLGPDMGRLISKTIRDSVSYGLEHREEALNYAMQFARDMDAELADKFVGMYVNKWTLGYGEKGKKAVRELIERGTAAGLLPGPAKVEFLEE